ncbi:MAG: glycine--tRNA ligase subunit beta [Halioglobus sp.]|nr:glycine--tRNA ligase subunit beta [Halioglobus sp.]
MGTESLLIEIGTEELPPTALKSLGLAFRDNIVAGLQQAALTHGDVRWFATPRRLAVVISTLQQQAPDKRVEALGPPAEKARDDNGDFTPAAAGFARKQGVAPDELSVIDTAKGARLGIVKTENGARAADVLTDIIQNSLYTLPIPKRMRWGAGREEFVRPVHWVVALLGCTPVEGRVLGLPIGNTTRGHRFHSSGEIQLEQPEDYETVLWDAHVVACFERRQEIIRAQVDETANRLTAKAVIDQDLLDEVTGLVEWPVALAGAFEERFLDVPAEALVSSMKEHQKYFHVVDEKGQLRPHFITVSNIESKDPAQVVAGNERVIRPRLADAAFFFETDKKTPLANRVDSLGNIVFQQKLGTLLDKTERITSLAGELAETIGSSPDMARRAARLCKADLGTDMVLEFSDMQGIAGAYYALHDGEDAEVASAIAQQYRPGYAGDKLPDTETAACLGLADRLDTLVGIFGIGQPPSGSKDPFALRRASLAVLRIIVEKGFDLDLRHCLERAAGQYPAGLLSPGTTEAVLDYMIERFRAWYEDDNIPAEVFKAVSARKPSRPLDIHQRVLAVAAFSRLPQAQALAAANKRVANILAKLDSDHYFSEVSANLLQEPQEIELAQHIGPLQASCHQDLLDGKYTEALTSLASLRDPVDAFFDQVMVNTDDEAKRNNRLNLLMQLRQLFLEVADISLLANSK